MTTAKGLTITQTENGLYLQIRRAGVLYGQFYRLSDTRQATRLFLELVDNYRTKSALAVMGDW
jgi:hypothetical protein